MSRIVITGLLILGLLAVTLPLEVWADHHTAISCPNSIPLAGPLGDASPSREIVGAYCKHTQQGALNCTTASVDAGNACIASATRACQAALPNPLTPSAAQTSTCATYCQSSSSTCTPRIVISPTPEVISQNYSPNERAPFTHYFESGGSHVIDLGVYTCSVALRLKGTCHCDPPSPNPKKGMMANAAESMHE
ncbi:MAG: hypothetical protein IPJ89_01375 [Candidatus Iainarchaeum archaeon]|uniref:Uncharacterized protein n=1 Tax=Candidatus Iainarchaeum sp. TaxID=3101447 RepID=A0A7T9DK98_9ARCH|nr:MAG: hypothetical protein IPJ89_01375 [Candidatus Diapherotrites archaeon]